MNTSYNKKSVWAEAISAQTLFHFASTGSFFESVRVPSDIFHYEGYQEIGRKQRSVGQSLSLPHPTPMLEL